MSCAVCDHPDRDDIDRALRSGTSIRAVCKAYGTSIARTHNHAKQHVQAGAPLVTVNAIPVEPSASGPAAPDEVETLLRATLAHAAAALKKAPSSRDVAMLVRAITPGAKLLAELTGRLGAVPVDREWEQMSAEQLDAEALKVLERNPEFLARVLKRKEDAA